MDIGGEFQLGADWLPACPPSRLQRCKTRLFGYLRQSQSWALRMQKWPPGQAPVVRRNRGFLWSLASTVYPGALWLHAIEMEDASIQASNHLLCTACIRGFNQPNIQLLHAFSLATESLIPRNGLARSCSHPITSYLNVELLLCSLVLGSLDHMANLPI